jgi:hypothetical protein
VILDLTDQRCEIVECLGVVLRACGIDASELWELGGPLLVQAF